jgi:hypothetical protein
VLTTKVVRNIVMTALTKIQHFFIRVLRVTENSVSVSLLPGQLGRFSQFEFFGHANLKIRCGVEYQHWSAWNPTPIDQKVKMFQWLSCWTRKYDRVAANFEKLGRISFCLAYLTLVISF